jgi:hypothetical protein
MNAEERLAWLLETEWVPTNRGIVLRDIYAAAGAYENQVALTLRQVKNPVFPEGTTVEQQNQALVLAEQVEQACFAMSTKDGLLLSDTKSQSLIDILAQLGGWPDETRDAVKALGGVWQPRWQSAGYASEPTIADAKRDILRDELVAKVNSVVSRLDNLDTAGMSAEDVQAAFDAMWGE